MDDEGAGRIVFLMCWCGGHGYSRWMCCLKGRNGLMGRMDTGLLGWAMLCWLVGVVG